MLIDLTDCTPTSSETAASETICVGSCNSPMTFFTYIDGTCNCYSKTGDNACSTVFPGGTQAKQGSNGMCPTVGTLPTRKFDIVRKDDSLPARLTDVDLNCM